MKKYWKTLKKISLTMSIALLFLISISIPMNIQPNNINFNNTDPSVVELPNTSLFEYENPIYGTGNNRTLRTFLQNSSEASGVSKFNISSDSNDEYLNKGQYNFTFDKSFNTTYILEDDTPLVSPDTDFDLNEEISLNNNLTLGSSGSITNGGTDSDIASIDFDYIEITSSGNLAIFNLTTDFSNSDYNETVIGFIVELNLRLFDDADLNVFIYDLIENKWDQVYSNLNYGVMGNYQSLIFNITNANLRYLTDTQNPLFSFSFSNTGDEFITHIDYVSIKLRNTNEILISEDEKSAALEFNIMGNSTFYGFQAWIRSFNVTAVGEDSNLTVGLYFTNLTTPLTRNDLVRYGDETDPIPTKPSTLIAEKSFINFSEDKPYWFDIFPSGIDLNISTNDIGNFFIVISSNTTSIDGGKGFSLVTLPYTEYSSDFTVSGPSDKESDIDHLLLEYDGIDWKRNYAITDVPYERYFEADAAAFSINLTRPYRPSEIEATIETESIQDTYPTIDNYPYDTTGDYATTWWGFGTIDHTYDTPIQATYNNFEVPITWNNSIYSGNIDVNVKYNVEKYYDEDATADYTLNLEENPVWNVSYYFDNTSSKLDNWNFVEMWYFMPEDWTFINFAGPDQIDYTINTTFSAYDDNQNVLKVNSSVVGDGEAGFYQINAESNNYIRTCELQLHYNEYKWTTNGFMPGDNVSLAVGVSDSDGRFIQNNGEISANIYNTSGELVSKYNLYDNLINTNDTYSWYKFQSQDIFYETETLPTGTYQVILNWTNGDQVGLFKRELYLNKYEANILDFDNYDQETQTNEIHGTVNSNNPSFVTDINTYDLYIYAIKNLTSGGDFSEYFVNRSTNENLGSETDLYMVNFMQNETVLNADEDVNFIINLENHHHTLNYDVSITAELISLINPENEWIISSSTSNTQNIAISGDPHDNDKKEFDFSLNIPTPAEGGVNCPIRNGPMAIKIIVEIGGTAIFEQIQEEILYYTTLSDTEFEGDACQPIKIYEERMGPSFIASIDRSTLDLPENISYFVQVVNDYFMGTETENDVYKPSQYYKVDGNILDFKIEQNEINRISSLNLIGQAVDEYENPLASINLELNYNDSVNWVPLEGASESNQITTDGDGFFNFEFSLFNTPKLADMQIMASYAGNDSVLAFDKFLNFTLSEYNTDIDLIFENITLIKPVHNIISFKIVNIGNSTLENVTLTIENSTYNGFVYSMNILKSEILNPGDFFIVEIDFFDNKYNEDFANITIKVEAFVREIGEQQVLHETQYTFTTYTINEGELSSTTVVLFFFVGAGLLWAFGGLFIKKKITEFNTVPETYVSEKKTTKKRRTGKYVNVSDLSRETEKKSNSSEESSTSLDDLLDEEDSK
ncbi:hypothetical protein DSAG12_02492 [Promethearchaeum syntrophicum]|uniref:Uncharacterized protein n=1 Tax=Promethearchaeum syntrophicum TaxID=2594042 RepID=A0A5B9DC22_9ARCH|nr:hypothetical protein [Candidatus Prometheoarchaeum syntrophicum]QEE16662.1 hypothetical protein DSAG12_02492 [Candidatus Prometheoarchaeum syntrophicum]